MSSAGEPRRVSRAFRPESLFVMIVGGLDKGVINEQQYRIGMPVRAHDRIMPPAIRDAGDLPR